VTSPRESPDGYCRYCCKMIPIMAFGRVLITHFTFRMVSMRSDSAPDPCIGTVPDNTITHYMDDPKAAFE
jgi:hypothetical protein